MIVNLAERAHNHNWRVDPIVRSLLDTDFYKLLMLQFIWKHFAQVEVRFTITNRTSWVRLAEQIAEDDLRMQLEYVRGLRVRKSEMIWLAGNTFYGTRGIFEPQFLEWLDREFELPEYGLRFADGQMQLEFAGPWAQVTLWEVYALSILSELKTRAALAKLSEFELDILYARAKARLWGKVERLRGVPGLRLADFGTRRRHSFLWQEYVVKAMRDGLGDAFTGTSNTYLAYKHDLEAIGTNAHELPMALAALADDDAGLRASQYALLELWQKTYDGELLVMLPDTYGTTQFLRGAPDWVADWTGQRIDSKDPFVAGEEYIAWLERRGRDPKSKRMIASDGLDVDTILALHAQFAGRIQAPYTAWDFQRAEDFQDPKKWRPERRIRFSAGWGTLLTNDFRDCDPRGETGKESALDPISLVCKLAEANGRPTVKLSDNAAKASGTTADLIRYRRVFGTEGMSNLPTLV